MYQLDPSAFDLVRPLLRDAWFALSSVYAPLDGNNPGRVWVDDPAQPSSALITPGAATGDFFPVGRADNEAFNQEMVALLRDELLPALSPQHGAVHVMFYSYTPEWHAALDRLLAPWGVQRIVRILFALDHDLFRALHGDWRARVPEGLRVVPPEESLVAQDPGCEALWGSAAEFMRWGVAAFVVDGDALVSRSQTVFVGGGHAEIGIHTAPEYRRRGLAILAAAACIEVCLERGLEPDWGCFYNEASKAMAGRMGFKPLPDAIVHYVRWEDTGAAEG